MRRFQCYDCGHTWELPHGEGGRGTDLACPQCGSRNVHRSSKERGRGWRRGERDTDSTTDRGRGWRHAWKKPPGPPTEE
jgi:DNA-directed RNA polymerase subunit RPC12/RpoP